MTAWGGFKNRFRSIGLACILWGILFAGLGLAQDFVLYLVIMFLAGIPMPLFNVPTTTLLQEIVEPDIQGRVFGVMQLITNTVLPAGMLIFGPIADVITIEFLLLLSGAMMALPGLWIFFRREPAPGQPGVGPVEYEWRGSASQQPGD
jgi:DHA3 family macrolide efflux protein-like MFS transporter